MSRDDPSPDDPPADERPAEEGQAPRASEPTVVREAREPAPTVVLPRSDEPDAEEPGEVPEDETPPPFTPAETDFRVVAGPGCALQIGAGFAFVGMVTFTLVAVVFGLRLADRVPGFGHAVLFVEASLALGCVLGAAQIVRHLRAVTDAWRRRPVAVPRALAAHRDFVATAAASGALAFGGLVVGAALWFAG